LNACHTIARRVSRGVHEAGPTSHGSLIRVSSREAPLSMKKPRILVILQEGG
jgi:hypothetical protein